MITLLIGAAIGAIFGMVAAELLDISAWLSPRIVRRASRRMPTESLQERYEEEWLSELASLEGLKAIKLVKALGIYFGSYGVERTYRGEGYVTGALFFRRCRATLPAVLRRTWQGRYETAPGFMIGYQLMMLVDLRPDIDVADGEQGGGVVSISVRSDVRTSASVRLAYQLVQLLIPALVVLHESRLSGSLRAAMQTVYSRWRTRQSGDQFIEDGSPIFRAGLDYLEAKRRGDTPSPTDK